MRKLMLLAAMLAMVLVAAAPALAQDAEAGDIDSSVNDSGNVNIQYADCDVVQAAAVEQYGGDADALGEAAAASVANEVGVDQDVVLACLNSTISSDGGDDTTTTGDDTTTTGEEGTSGDDSSEGAEMLPDTGGASLFALGAGALLVGGGLLARRIFS